MQAAIEKHRSGRLGVSTRAKSAVAASAVALSLVGIGFGLGIGADATAPVVVAAPVGAPGGAIDRTLGASQDSYAAVVNQVSPAVVTIRAERKAKAVAMEQFPFMNDPRFRDFFGDQFGQTPQMPRQRREGSLGSGVLVSTDGYLLTNHHVIEGAENVRVELQDRRSFPAKVVGSDKPSDLAVLKIDGRNFPTLALGDSNQVRVGDVVLAVGNPLGVGQTVTLGIISAKGRATGIGDGSFEDFLQTDAPINQGNSGGALVNTRGELIGINSQILSPSGGNIGIGFAIPAAMARSVMAQLVDHGDVRRGMLGVTVQSLTSDMAASLGLSSMEGALVNSVQDGSAAERAGVRRGDVIMQVNGTRVADNNSLRNQVASLGPGATVDLKVVRNGKEQSMQAKLDELPNTQRTPGTPDTSPEGGKFGLSVQPVTPADAERLGARGAEGLVITNLDPDGPAAQSGFQEGDIIAEVNGKAVRSASELKSSLDAATDRPALVLVNRRSQTLFLTLTK